MERQPLSVWTAMLQNSTVKMLRATFCFVPLEKGSQLSPVVGVSAAAGETGAAVN